MRRSREGDSAGGRRTRRLRLAVELEFDARIPLPDGAIVTALADGLPTLDEGGLLFPGIEHPRHLERLLDWSVMLAGSGGAVRPTPLDRAVEARRRDGGVPPVQVRAPAARSAEVEEEIAAVQAEIDDLEPRLVEIATAAWSTASRLRYATARLDEPHLVGPELREVLAEAQAAFEAGQELAGGRHSKKE